MTVFKSLRAQRLEARRPPPGSSFFVDSTGYSALTDREPPRARRSVSEVTLFAIALAAAVGIAGVFGLLHLLRP